MKPSKRDGQDAVIHNFEIIGEASHNIESHYPEFAAAHPELPFAFAFQNDLAWLYEQVRLALQCLPLEDPKPAKP